MSVSILIGIPLYIYFSPKTDLNHLKDFFTSEDAVMARNLGRKYVFLANLIRMTGRLCSRFKRKQESEN